VAHGRIRDGRKGGGRVGSELTAFKQALSRVWVAMSNVNPLSTLASDAGLQALVLTPAAVGRPRDIDWVVMPRS
jgi:hypothetical protein